MLLTGNNWHLLIGIFYFDTLHKCYLVSVVWCKTSLTFLCSKDSLRITDGVDEMFGAYCGNKTAGKNLHVTGERMKLIFHSDGEIERRGYLLNFTLVSLPSFSSGKCGTITKPIRLQGYFSQ